MKRSSTKSNPHHGSSFEAFLEEEGYLEQATAKAIKRVMAWQLRQAMKERKVSKAGAVRSSIESWIQPTIKYRSPAW